MKRIADPRLAKIWRNTHRNSKGIIDGVRCILTYREGTCLVPLDALTEGEIADKFRFMPTDKAPERIAIQVAWQLAHDGER